MISKPKRMKRIQNEKITNDNDGNCTTIFRCRKKNKRDSGFYKQTFPRIQRTKETTMTLPDALLNAKKYIHEPKYHEKERMWGYELRDHGQWVPYFTITEEACWEAFYKQFWAIKESLMAGNERSKK